MTTKQVQEFKETEIGKISKDYEVVKLGEMLTLLKDGSHNPPKRVSTGIPFIAGATEIKYFDIDFSKATHITKEDYDELHKKFEVEKDDILLTIVGTVGNVAIVKEEYLPFSLQRNIAILRPNKELHYSYLFYWLTSSFFKNILYQRGNRTAQPRFYLRELANTPIIIQPLEIQKKNANFLFSIDQKIRNLQNQNRTLEQMAQAIFQSWFVDFDGVTEFEDSELGNIPKGWSVKQIKDFCKVRRGASPRPVGDPKYFGGDIPWIKIADVSKSPSPYLFSTKETVTEEGAKKSVHLPKNSLIISNSGTVGKPIFLTRDGCIHDGWLYFENLIEISQEFLYFHLLTLTAHLNLMGDGTVQKNLNTTIIGEIKFVCPEKKYLDSFLKISQIFLKTIKENQIKINTLTSLRDALLPKLMSGEIRV